jgi:hypothetical protein
MAGGRSSCGSSESDALGIGTAWIFSTRRLHSDRRRAQASTAASGEGTALSTGDTEGVDACPEAGGSRLGGAAGGGIALHVSSELYPSGSAGPGLPSTHRPLSSRFARMRAYHERPGG